MRTIHFVCWLALPVAALLCDLGAAHAQAVNVEQACTPDAERLCSEFIPDRDKVARCMISKRRLLSVECRTAMAAGHHVERRHYVRRYHERRVRHVTRHYHHYYHH